MQNSPSTRNEFSLKNKKEVLELSITSFKQFQTDFLDNTKTIYHQKTLNSFFHPLTQ